MSLPPCALCRLLCPRPFFLGSDFSILLCDHHCKFFFTFFSCVSIDVELLTLSVCQFWRVTALPFVRTDLEYTSGSGAADFGLFRLKFCRLLCFYIHTTVILFFPQQLTPPMKPQLPGWRFYLSYICSVTAILLTARGGLQGPKESASAP